MTPSPVASGAGVAVEVTTSLDRLEALAPEWSDLLQRDRGATPFQRPEWVIPWYRVFAPRDAHVFTVRDDAGRLVALAPCVHAAEDITLAGEGPSDYRGPIVDDDRAGAAADALDVAFDREASSCVFDDVPAESTWARTRRGNPRWRMEPACVCPVVPLPSSVREWRDGLSAGLNRNIRRYGQKLLDDVGARYDTVTSPTGAGAGLNALFRLHNLRWHQHRRTGVLHTGDIRRFHDLSAPRLLAAGVARLHRLFAGSDAIGAQYILVGGKRAFSYIGGFDPAWSRYGPGTLLMAHAIACAIDEGCGEFDLLRGAEPYKYAWGAVNRTSLRLVRSRALDDR